MWVTVLQGSHLLVVTCVTRTFNLNFKLGSGQATDFNTVKDGGMRSGSNPDCFSHDEKARRGLVGPTAGRDMVAKWIKHQSGKQLKKLVKIVLILKMSAWPPQLLPLSAQLKPSFKTHLCHSCPQGHGTHLGSGLCWSCCRAQRRHTRGVCRVLDRGYLVTMNLGQLGRRTRCSHNRPLVGRALWHPRLLQQPVTGKSCLQACTGTW